MGFKHENTTGKAKGEQKLLSKLGSDFRDQSTKWDFGAQIKNASNFAQALLPTHTTCVELDFQSNHSYSKFETDFQPENTLSVQPQNPPQGNPWNPAFPPAFSSVWVHPGFNFLSPTLSFALQMHCPNGTIKSSFEQHPQEGSKNQFICDFKEKSHPFSKGAQQSLGKGLSSMDDKMIMEETSKLTKVNAMRITLFHSSWISMWISIIGGFTFGSSLGSKYGFHLEGPVLIPNVFPERAITLMKISPVTQAKLAPLVTLPNGSGIDSFTLPSANLSMILANSSVLYSRNVNFINSDFYASIPEPSALNLDPPGIGNPTLGPNIPSACGTSEFAHTQLSLQIHPPPYPTLSDTFNSEKKANFHANFAMYTGPSVSEDPQSLGKLFIKKCKDFWRQIWPRSVIPKVSTPVIPSIWPKLMFFSLKFGIPMSVCLVLILHFMRKPCKYFLLKKARKISLPFGRTLHSKLPRRPKSPQKYGKLGKSLLRVACMERGAPPTLKNTAIRFDPYANNLWVNSNAGKTSPPGSRTKSVPGGDFWLVKPGSRLFSRHPGPQSNNTKSGEMPMSPANSAPDPPPLAVRNNPIKNHAHSEKCGGGVLSGQQRYVFFSGNNNPSTLVQEHQPHPKSSVSVQKMPPVSMPQRVDLCASPSPLVHTPVAQTSVQKKTFPASPQISPVVESPLRFLGSWEAQNVTAESSRGPHNNLTLHFSARCLVSPNEWAILRIAVDSGAAHCAINSRVVPIESTRPLKVPIIGYGINGQPISGGDREIRLNLQVDAWQKAPFPIILPTAFVVHDFGMSDVDAIVSYQWCAERCIKIDALGHVLELMFWNNNPLVQVPKLNLVPLPGTCYIRGLPDAPRGKITGRQCEMLKRTLDKKTMEDAKKAVQESMEIPTSPRSPTESIRSFASDESFSVTLSPTQKKFDRGVLQAVGSAIFNAAGQLREGQPGGYPSCPCASHNWCTSYVDGQGILHSTRLYPTLGGYATEVGPEELYAHQTQRCDCKNFYEHREFMDGNFHVIYSPINMLRRSSFEVNTQSARFAPAASARSSSQTRQRISSGNPSPVDLRLTDHPTNFWFCRKCLQFWGRDTSPYVITLQYEDYLTHHVKMHFDFRIYRRCEDCEGSFKYHANRENGEMHTWATWTGSCVDDEGRWVYLGSELTPCAQDPTGHLHRATPRLLRDGTCPNVLEYGFIKDELPYNYDTLGGIKGGSGAATHFLRMMSQGDNPQDQPVTPEYAPPLPANLSPSSPPPSSPSSSVTELVSASNPSESHIMSDPNPSSSSPDQSDAQSALLPPQETVTSGDPGATASSSILPAFSPAIPGNIENLDNLTSADPPDFRAADEHFNFWFCEFCAGWWARLETPYRNALYAEQHTWDRTHPKAKSYNYHCCEKCKGESRTLSIRIDGEYVQRPYFNGDFWDSTGQWWYVGGKVRQLEIPGQDPIQEGTLVPLFDRPTPRIFHHFLGNYEPIWHMEMRSRKIQEENELGPPKFRVSCQPPAKIQKKDEHDSDPEADTAESRPQPDPSLSQCAPTPSSSSSLPSCGAAYHFSGSGKATEGALQQGSLPELTHDQKDLTATPVTGMTPDGGHGLLPRTHTLRDTRTTHSSHTQSEILESFVSLPLQITGEDDSLTDACCEHPYLLNTIFPERVRAVTVIKKPCKSPPPASWASPRSPELGDITRLSHVDQAENLSKSTQQGQPEGLAMLDFDAPPKKNEAVEPLKVGRQSPTGSPARVHGYSALAAEHYGTTVDYWRRQLTQSHSSLSSGGMIPCSSALPSPGTSSCEEKNVSEKMDPPAEKSGTAEKNDDAEKNAPKPEKNVRNWRSFAEEFSSGPPSPKSDVSAGETIPIELHFPDTIPSPGTLIPQLRSHFWLCENCYGFWVDLRAEYAYWWQEQQVWSRDHGIFTGHKKVVRCKDCDGVRTIWTTRNTHGHWQEAREASGLFFDGDLNWRYVGSVMEIFAYPTRTINEGAIDFSPPHLENCNTAIPVLETRQVNFTPAIMATMDQYQLMEWKRYRNPSPLHSCTPHSPSPSSPSPSSPSASIGMLRARVASPERDTSEDQSDPGDQGHLRITYNHDEPQTSEVYCDSQNGEDSQPPTGTESSDHESQTSRGNSPLRITHNNDISSRLQITLPELTLEPVALGNYPVMEYATLPAPPVIQDSHGIVIPASRLSEGGRRSREDPEKMPTHRSQKNCSDESPPEKLARRHSPMESDDPPPVYTEEDPTRGSHQGYVQNPSCTDNAISSSSPVTGSNNLNTLSPMGTVNLGLIQPSLVDVMDVAPLLLTLPEKMQNLADEQKGLFESYNEYVNTELNGLDHKITAVSELLDQKLDRDIVHTMDNRFSTITHRVRLTEESLEKMERARTNTTTFINQEVGKLRHDSETLQANYTRWEKIIGDNLQTFENRMQEVESQRIPTGPPSDDMAQTLLQEFGRLRQEWVHQKAVLQNIQQDVTTKIAEKKDHPECDAALKNMWEQAQNHIGELTARVTLLEKKRSMLELGEIPQQVTNLQGSVTQIHRMIDDQADILNNVHSRLERLEGQVQQEAVPELRANFYGMNRNFETLAQSYQHMREAVSQLVTSGNFSASPTKKKSAKKLSPPVAEKKSAKTPPVEHMTLDPFTEPRRYDQPLTSAPPLILGGWEVTRPQTVPRSQVLPETSAYSRVTSGLDPHAPSTDSKSFSRPLSEKSSEKSNRKGVTRVTRRERHPPDSDSDSTVDTRRSISPPEKFRIEPPARPALGFGSLGITDAASVCPPSEAAMYALGAASAVGSTPFMHPSWINPLHGLNILQMAKKPSPFTGREAGDWQRFSREWKPYEKILEQTYPPTMWDTVKLENLKGLLDKTSLADFQAKYEANNELTFEEFWEEIDREFGRDATAQNRAAWKKVRLHQSGKRLSLDDWRAFQREFVLRRGRVEDRTENEEWELLIAQLPTYWTTEVAKEESKRDLRGHWVKVTNTPELTKRDMEYILKTQLKCRLQEVQKIDNGFRVSLKSESEQTKLLKMHGTKIEGRPMKITRHQPKMTPDEIFQFVATRLRTTEGALDVKRTITSLDDTRADDQRIRAVTLELPKSQSHTDSDSDGKNSDKSRKKGTMPEKKSANSPRQNSSGNAHSQGNSATRYQGGRGKGSYENSRPPQRQNWEPNRHQNGGKSKGERSTWANQGSQNWGTQGTRQNWNVSATPPSSVPTQRAPYPFKTREQQDAEAAQRAAARGKGKGQTNNVPPHAQSSTFQGKGHSQGTQSSQPPSQNNSRGPGPRIQH